jgi:hypothetical protein
MSLAEPFLEAYASFGVEPGADSETVRRAYRRAVLEHPPDRDPDGFRRIRAAYELICDPAKCAEEILLDPSPRIAPPKAPDAPVIAPGTAAVALMRWLATEVDAAALLREGDKQRGGKVDDGNRMA